jgi:hypothetical protein
LRQLRDEPAQVRRYALDGTRAVLRRLRQPFRFSRRRTHNGAEQPFPADDVHQCSWHDITRRYCPSIYEGCVDLFSAEAPNWIGSDFSDATKGWGSLVKGELKLHRIPCHHRDIARPPHVNDLAMEIRQRLG